MSSFINLMKNDIWSETDILSRTEAMIESFFPAKIVNVLTRKSMGEQLGKYELTQAEHDEITHYNNVCTEAGIAAYMARQDMMLLREIIEVERAKTVISLPFDILTDDINVRDTDEKIVKSASKLVNYWIDLRNPTAI